MKIRIISGLAITNLAQKTWNFGSNLEFCNSDKNKTLIQVILDSFFEFILSKIPAGGTSEVGGSTSKVQR